jgi:hypothetical protein
MRELGLLSQYSDRLWAGQLGFNFQQGQEIFLFSTVYRSALGPAQPPIRWILGTLSLGVKLPGHKADHLHPFSAEVKNGGAVPPLSQYTFMAWYFLSTRIPLLFT